MAAPSLEAAFPSLARAKYSIESPKDKGYNCIAWAAGENTRHWWPTGYSFWPEGVPRELTVKAFVLLFGGRGYSPCNDGCLEAGYEKIAIYSNQGIVTHAARQLRDGWWTSKLGRNVDIKHALEALDGSAYGRIQQFVRRRRAARGS